MDAVYLWVGKIVVWGSGGLFLWLVLGATAFLIYDARWRKHNGCWTCGHGDVNDPVALWFASRHTSDGGLVVMALAAPILTLVGIATFYLIQLPFERTRKREASAA